MYQLLMHVLLLLIWISVQCEISIDNTQCLQSWQTLTQSQCIPHRYRRCSVRNTSLISHMSLTINLDQQSAFERSALKYSSAPARLTRVFSHQRSTLVL